MLVGPLVGALATQHAANLLDHTLAVEALHGGGGSLAAQILLQPEVGRRQRSDLRQVGDAEDLACFAERAQALADEARGLAADSRVDLIEDERPRPGALAEPAQSQHHPRELAAGSRVAQRRRSHSGVGGDQQLDRLATVCSEPLSERRQVDLQAGTWHRQLLELLGDPLPKRRRGGGPPLAQLLAELLAPHFGLGEGALDLGATGLGTLQPLDLGPAMLGMGEHRFDAAAVLAPQAIDCFQALLYRGEAARVSVDPIEVATQLGGDVAQFDRDGRQSPAQRVEIGIDAFDAMQERFGLGQDACRPTAVLVGPGGARQSAAGRLAQPLRVAQPLALG